MKILSVVTLNKYYDATRYTFVENGIYKDAARGVSGAAGITHDPVYCVTLSCELEENEDSQYPVEDILDRFFVNCTDVPKERIVGGRHIYILEVEGDELESIKEIAGLVGKRVFNEVEGDQIKLKIE